MTEDRATAIGFIVSGAFFGIGFVVGLLAGMSIY